MIHNKPPKAGTRWYLNGAVYTVNLCIILEDKGVDVPGKFVVVCTQDGSEEQEYIPACEWWKSASLCAEG